MEVTKVFLLILWVKPHRTLANSAVKMLSASWQEQDCKMLWTEAISGDPDYREKITVQIQRMIKGLQILIFHAIMDTGMSNYCLWLKIWSVYWRKLFLLLMNTKILLEESDSITIHSMISIKFIFIIISVLMCLYGLYQYIFCFFGLTVIFYHHLHLI